MTKMNPADPLQYAAALRRQRTRAPRVVLYSHDTLGFGHLRRNMLLAHMMALNGLEWGVRPWCDA